LAARGDAPKSLVRLNARGVPVRSVLMGSLAGLAGIAAATASPQGVFKFLVNASGALVVVIYLLIAFAQVRLRRARSAAEQRALPVQMWAYPASSYLVIAGMFAVLAAMASTPSMRRDFYASAVSVAVALIAAWLHGRRRAG
ncbi:MAG: amino acid permease, partial [Proteobacteria bacterium]|nr:amino acid permease [Pseudomonadota bacterium]